MKQDLDVKAQVRQILKVVQEIAPGRSVEIRIPPYAAIQCVEGVNHRRGTPPNVVEMAPETLIALSHNSHKWHELSAEGIISTSGTHSNLKELFLRVSIIINSQVRRDLGK
jgi:hypothetical protein